MIFVDVLLFKDPGDWKVPDPQHCNLYKTNRLIVALSVAGLMLNFVIRGEVDEAAAENPDEDHPHRD